MAHKDKDKDKKDKKKSPVKPANRSGGGRRPPRR